MRPRVLRAWTELLEAWESRSKRCPLLLTLLGIAFAASAGAAVVELTADRDNSLFEAEDFSNGADPALFAGNTGSGAKRRALLHFDVSGRIPPGARVDSVTLTLQVTNSPNDFSQPFSLHRVRGDWGEGSSITSGGSGAPAQLGDATWRDAFYPGRRWSSPGGDFDLAPSATRMVEGLGSYTWHGLGLTRDVREWLSQPDSNEGWLLHGEETVLQTARRFGSRESGEAYSRPTITIYYTPAAITRSHSWGSLKAAYR